MCVYILARKLIRSKQFVARAREEPWLHAKSSVFEVSCSEILLHITSRDCSVSFFEIIRSLYFNGPRSVMPVASFDNSPRTRTRIHLRIHPRMHTCIVCSGHLIVWCWGAGQRQVRSPPRLRPLRAILDERTNGLEHSGYCYWYEASAQLGMSRRVRVSSFPIVHSSVLSLAYSDQHIATPIRDRLIVELFTLAVSYR